MRWRCDFLAWRRRRAAPWIAEFDAVGVRVRRLDECRRLGAWRSVVAIWAFQLDRFTTDLLCLAIKADRGWLQIDKESMRGWDDLLRRLPELVPGVRPTDEWLGESQRSAFATNPTRVLGDERPDLG